MLFSYLFNESIIYRYFQKIDNSKLNINCLLLLSNQLYRRLLSAHMFSWSANVCFR